MSTKTVWAPQIAQGDVVDDGNGGSYAQYGAVTAVARKGANVSVTTASGQRLSFLVADRVIVQR